MNKDRLTQLIAVATAVVCLVASIVLVPFIDRSRSELDLSFDTETDVGTPPMYVTMAAGLGSFRGIAACAIWYRAEMLKREGQHYEAGTLSQWITYLQPRFPQVWSFLAWNMAYNHSVEVKTPEERWDWVNKGVRLLREDGIPNNPKAILLYKELGWIFLHKMGQYTDDMHWYYKTKMAEEWTHILGSPLEGATTEEALEQFRQYAEYADKYFVFNRPTLAMKAEMDWLTAPNHHPELEEEFVAEMRKMDIVELDVATREVMKVLPRYGPEHVRDVDILLQLLNVQHARSKRDSMSLFLEDHPRARDVIGRLAEGGFQLNRSSLIRFGQLLNVLRINDPRMVRQIIDEQPEYLTEQINLTEGEIGVLDLLLQDDPELTQAVLAVRTYWRTQVLLKDYNMDPALMYLMMEEYGPIDWRHPAAHGAYWSRQGVGRALDLISRDGIDMLNTERNVIHGIQELAWRGKVNYDPATGHIMLLPEPRMFRGYEAALKKAYERWDPNDESIDLNGDGHLDTFEGGHENFLLKAILFSYLYGDVEESAEYYREVRELYGDKIHNAAGRRYTIPLEDFVLQELKSDGDMQTVNIALVDSLLRRAFTEGFANARIDVVERFFRIARKAQDDFKEIRDFNNAESTQSRLLFGSFEEVVTESFVNFLVDPAVPYDLRGRAYRFSPQVLPPQILYTAYRRANPALTQQAQATGRVVDAFFPRPPGMPEVEGLVEEQGLIRDGERTVITD